MNKRIVAVLTAILLGIGGAVAVSAPAWAAWTATKCPTAGQVCFSENTAGNGAIFRDNGPIGACQPMPGGWNDRVSSIWNRFTSSGGYIWLYEHAGCGGSFEDWGPNTIVDDLGFVWNDRASSFCIGLRSGSVRCP